MMPLPVTVEEVGGAPVAGDGGLAFRQSGCRDPRVEEAFSRFLSRVESFSGTPVSTVAGERPLPVAVECEKGGGSLPALGDDEAYDLSVSSSGVAIRAASPVGAIRAFATLYQLVEGAPSGFQIRLARVTDRPRFPWRGLLVDSSRHFMPIPVLKRTLDAMDVVKLNVLHWHLSDDQGFRVASRAFPRLHRAGSDGLFYSGDEVREIVDYARRRGIRVVPEFDVPGHTTAWFVGYPELASEAGPYRIERKFGIFDPAMDPGKREVYAFLDGLVGEMAGLFPDEYFHVGGDEVNGKAWGRSASVRAFQAERNLPDGGALQAAFTSRLQRILSAHGKKMIGWDEVLHGNLDRDVVVQSYRWHRKLVEAASRGNPSILSSGYYLDLMFSAAWHYGVDPLGEEAATLPPEKRSLVLGGEACMWTEFATAENIDAKIWPRAAAIAERLWSPASTRSVEEMYRRLALVSVKLEAAGTTHLQSRARMIRRLAGPGPATRSVEILSEALEPVKEYARVESGRYTSETPLTRLVDLLHPESEVARLFMLDVDALMAPDAAGNGSAPAQQRVARMLELWRDNDEFVQDAAQGNPLLLEAAAASTTLAACARIGLEALHRVAPPGDRKVWKTDATSLLEKASLPRNEVVIAVASAIRRLVERTEEKSALVGTAREP